MLVLGRRHLPWKSRISLACGRATLQPGDGIVTHGDGVIENAPKLAEEVADSALVKEVGDAWVAQQVAWGQPVGDLLPINAQRLELCEGRDR